VRTFFHSLFLVLDGKFLVFSPVWSQGMLNVQDCCQTRSAASSWATAYVEPSMPVPVVRSCGSKLGTLRLVPPCQKEASWEALTQAHAGQWKIDRSWKKLMEMNNFLIILYFAVFLCLEVLFTPEPVLRVDALVRWHFKIFVDSRT